MILTVEVDVDRYLVRLTATEYVGAVTFTRYQAGKATPLGEGPAYTDYTVPLGEPVRYYATDDATTVTDGALHTVESDRPVIGSTLLGETYAVDVYRYRPVEWQARSVAHAILGTSTPVVSVAPALYPSGTITFLLDSPTHRVQVLTMLGFGDPIILRSPCTDRVDDQIFLPLRWRDPWLTPDRPGSRQTLEVEYQAVVSTPTLYPPLNARTYSEVRDGGTYRVIRDTYGTYRGIKYGRAPA